MMIWFSAVGGSVWASNPTVWHQGELKLTNGIEWKGDLNYNWKAEVVQCRQGAIIKAYSASQVSTFMYFDDLQNAIRRFTSVECSAKFGRRRVRILEEVVPGPILVYREPRLGPNLIKSATMSGYDMNEQQDKDISNFSYLVLSDEELIPLDRFYRKVWPHLKTAFEEDIKKYAALTQANMTGIVGQLRLIYRYNYLVGQLPARMHSETTGPLLGQ